MSNGLHLGPRRQTTAGARAAQARRKDAARRRSLSSLLRRGVARPAGVLRTRSIAASPHRHEVRDECRNLFTMAKVTLSNQIICHTVLDLRDTAVLPLAQGFSRGLTVLNVRASVISGRSRSEVLRDVLTDRSAPLKANLANSVHHSDLVKSQQTSVDFEPTSFVEHLLAPGWISQY
jgi:hypothetical protein